MANQGSYTWAELAELAANLAGINAEPWLQRVPQTFFNWPAARPSYTVLETNKRAVLPSVEDALLRYLHTHEFSFRPVFANQPEEVEEENLISPRGA
ncbi:hypothetical protein GCM10027199_86880 [Amycolatopsis magusensis]